MYVAGDEADDDDRDHAFNKLGLNYTITGHWSNLMVRGACAPVSRCRAP